MFRSLSRVQSCWVNATTSSYYFVCLVRRSTAVVSAALCGDKEAVQVQVWGLMTAIQLKEANHQQLCCSNELSSRPCWRQTGDTMRAAVHKPRPHSIEVGPGWRLFSEESPSNISKVPSVSEKDNIHLGVKQCCNKEGLSLASLQESTEAIFTKPFIKVLLLTCKFAEYRMQ